VTLSGFYLRESAGCIARRISRIFSVVSGWWLFQDLICGNQRIVLLADSRGFFRLFPAGDSFRILSAEISGLYCSQILADLFGYFRLVLFQDLICGNQRIVLLADCRGSFRLFPADGSFRISSARISGLYCSRIVADLFGCFRLVALSGSYLRESADCIARFSRIFSAVSG